MGGGEWPPYFLPRIMAGRCDALTKRLREGGEGSVHRPSSGLFFIFADLRRGLGLVKAAGRCSRGRCRAGLRSRPLCRRIRRPSDRRGRVYGMVRKIFNLVRIGGLIERFLDGLAVGGEERGLGREFAGFGEFLDEAPGGMITHALPTQSFNLSQCRVFR